jgi:hypothetical protein
VIRGVNAIRIVSPDFNNIIALMGDLGHIYAISVVELHILRVVQIGDSLTEKLIGRVKSFRDFLIEVSLRIYTFFGLPDHSIFEVKDPGDRFP